MRAIVRETYGPPDVLHLEDVSVPTLGDGDVLVRLSFEEAATLPTAGCMALQGLRRTDTTSTAGTH
jgi:NADPH:quinone reductase-like Zn-dependent oxidoreductase